MGGTRRIAEFAGVQAGAFTPPDGLLKGRAQRLKAFFAFSPACFRFPMT